MKARALIRKNLINEQISTLCELGESPRIAVVTAHADYIGPTHLDNEGGFTMFNISASAVQNYLADDDGISFNATFSGKQNYMFVPYNSIILVAAKDDPQVAFYWEVLNVESELPVVTAPSTAPGALPEAVGDNNGAPIGHLGWKPTLVS